MKIKIYNTNNNQTRSHKSQAESLHEIRNPTKTILTGICTTNLGYIFFYFYERKDRRRYIFWEGNNS